MGTLVKRLKLFCATSRLPFAFSSRTIHTSASTATGEEGGDWTVVYF
jgi:hypothetical protein